MQPPKNTAPPAKKRTLTFVSEGVTDLATQRAREQVEQAKFEAECKRRERKSLRDQLKANAVNKQKEYNGLVKERDDLNRLSAEDLAHLNALAAQQRHRENSLNHYLQHHTSDFQSRQKHFRADQTEQPEQTPSANSSPAPHKPRHRLSGVVRRDSHREKRLNLKLARP